MNLWKWQNVGTWLSRQNLTSRTLGRRKSRGFSKLPAEVLESRALLSTLTVTTLEDSVNPSDDQVSLREAIATANTTAAQDTIVFANSLSGGALDLDLGQLAITQDLIIEGGCEITIDAGGDSRIFDITGAGTSVSLQGLTLLNGSVDTAGGGAIRTSAADLTLERTTISGSVADGVDGGAILVTGVGDLTVLESTLSENSTVGVGADGGAIAFASSGTLTLTNATLSGNFTTDATANGGAVFMSDGTLLSTNSTIAFNDAGGIGGGINALLADAVTINNTIIATNTSGVSAPDLRAGATAVVNNSLIGVNAGTTLAATVGSVADVSGNFIGTIADPIDPLLAALADNGGCVETHALLPGSLALDAGDAALAVGLDSDARSDCFFRIDAGGSIDIGAFQTQAQITISPPVNIVPDDLQMIESTTLTFSQSLGTQLAVYAPSAGGEEIQVTLAAANGTLTLGQIAGLTFSAGDGTGDTTMTFTGTVANINAALEGTGFTPNFIGAGAATVTMTTSDLGIDGEVAQIDTDVVNISVTSVSTPLEPVITAPITIEAASGTSLVFSAGTGQIISIADLDAGSSDLDVTLTATHGMLTLGTVVPGLTVGGDGTAVVTLTGTVEEINAALAGLQFNSSGSYTGPATIQVDVTDADAQTDTATIAVNVNAANLAPTITLPSVDSIVVGTDLVLGADLNGAWTTNNPGTNVFTTIVQSGDQLIITNRKGQSYYGKLSVVDGVVTITQYGRFGGPVNELDDVTATATLSADGKSIFWSTGHIWTRTIVPTTTSIVIGDDSSASSVVLVEIVAENATITLSQTTGLTFIDGDGSADTTLRVLGTAAAINAALKGAIITPTGDVDDEVCLTVKVSDEALSGALSSTQVLHLDVEPNLGGVWVNSHGNQTFIVQLGDQLYLIGAQSPVAPATLDSDTQLTVGGSHGLQGTAQLVGDDTILFELGEVWNRLLVPGPTVLDEMFASV